MADDAAHLEAWKEHTTAFDRVRSVAGTVSRPRSASWVAGEAAVAENTARDHLERLVEMNVLLRTTRDGTALYAPDPLYTRAQTLRDYLDEYDHEGLVELKAEISERLDALRDEYGVDSPEELRERVAETDDVERIQEFRNAASDWELARYRLGVLDEAIRNYAAYDRHDAVSVH